MRKKMGLVLLVPVIAGLFFIDTIDGRHSGDSTPDRVIAMEK